jgi:hypothetical protein
MILDEFGIDAIRKNFGCEDYVENLLDTIEFKDKHIQELERDYISTKRIICLILKQIGGKIEIPIIDMIQTDFKDYELLYADNEKTESKIIALKEV